VAKIALSPSRRAPNLLRQVRDNAADSVPGIIADLAEMAVDRGVIVATPLRRVMVPR